MSIQFDGLNEVFNRLEGLADINKFENALGKACAIVERDAKKAAPKGDGDLRRSITSKIEKDGEELRGVVFTPLEYAPYVEYGTGLFAENNGGRKDVPWSYKDDKGEWHNTSGMHPMPYMRPALDSNREQILRIIGGALLDD